MNLTPFRKRLVDEMVVGFATPESPREWVGAYISGGNVYDNIVGESLSANVSSASPGPRRRPPTLVSLLPQSPSACVPGASTPVLPRPSPTATRIPWSG